MLLVTQEGCWEAIYVINNIKLVWESKLDYLSQQELLAHKERAKHLNKWSWELETMRRSYKNTYFVEKRWMWEAPEDIDDPLIKNMEEENWDLKRNPGGSPSS
jgi:hypothetical protein